MEQVNIEEMRRLLACYFAEDDECIPNLTNKTDEEILKVNLTELGFDSLDCMDMIVIALGVENYNDLKFENSEFRKEQTVENFIKLCNEM